MKNYWVQLEAVVATWYADVTPLLDAPERLLALVRSVYEAAARTRMVRPIGFDPVADLALKWEREQTIEVFWRMKNLPVETDLAWFDASDSLVEGGVKDLGALLASLEPRPNSITDSARYLGEPPVALMGGYVRYLENSPSPRPKHGETFNIALHSDIWLPFVSGFAHPSWDGERWFDNRALAERHTPRLNELLTTVGRIVAEAGCRWYLDKDAVAKNYLPWLSNEGIRLDGPAPPLMPHELVDVDWPDLDA